jgi:uncharacterized protein YjbI with pentapeptide repeats
MANPEHLAKLKEGVKAWNQWRKENPEIRPDLRGADLSRVNLIEADLSETNLIKANLFRADLNKVDLEGADLCEAFILEANLSAANLRGAALNAADLIGANLHEADLSGASLAGADLIGANLIGADFRTANLHGADLSGANLLSSNLSGADLSAARLGGANLSFVDLSGTDLRKALVGSTTFANVDLSGVKGLETVEHYAPSGIGIDTIYKSKGKIPHAFLRGAGVPENFIEYMASLVGTGIEFYSLFISYSTHDQEFAKRLHADLQDKGVRCWFAPHDLRGGKKVYRQIDEAIRVYDKLLLILSPASMESEWVRTEIAIARKREVEQKREVLFPIGLCPFKTIRKWEYFDSDIGKDSAREIREFHIPDFSNWTDPVAYRKAFDRLLADLHGKPDPSFA